MLTARLTAPLALALALVSSASIAAPYNPAPPRPAMSRSAAPKQGFFSKMRDKFDGAVARFAASRDFNAWTREQGNAQTKTFYKGARADQHVVAKKFVRAGGMILTVGAAVGTAASILTGNPLGFVIGGAKTAAFGVGTHLLTKNIRSSEATARGRAIGHSYTMGVAPDDTRIANWQRAGIVH